MARRLLDLSCAAGQDEDAEVSPKKNFDESPPTVPPNIATSYNADYIESLYHWWRERPSELAETWQAFFQGFELALGSRDGVSADQASAQSRVASLIYAYRSQGHRIAQVDPLGRALSSHPDLNLEAFGFSTDDLETIFDTGHLPGPQLASLREILAHLEQTYCRSVGVEYIHIQDVAIRRWLQTQMEGVHNRPAYDEARKREILEQLLGARMFEQFVHARYRGQKRFSLEGAETLIAALHSIVALAPELGIAEIVMGMAHRGRLNVLANILDKSHLEIFSEFEDNFIADSYAGDGDVKYHKGFSSDHVNAAGRGVHLTLSSNPSHLEAVYPVVQGKARAKQRQHGDTRERKTVLPLVIHGDAAFAGQGVVAETLNLSQLEGYRTGGTLHIIVNNQIGFTTTPTEARSSAYATDVAKMIEAPVFHVNGDDPEQVCFVAELALRFRQQFSRDVVVDMVCYRRHGHNEGDEPAFTQPALYRQIRDRQPVDRLYADTLVSEGHIEPKFWSQLSEQLKGQLQVELDEVKGGAKPTGQAAFDDVWSGLNQSFSHEPVATAVAYDTLSEVATGLCTVPSGFSLNPKVVRTLEKRYRAIKNRDQVDWAFAELLAFGSLLLEGTDVRLSGQDSERGTFSQRHSVWQDMQSGQPYVPLNHLRQQQAHFCVYNSSLSEAAVLGFDYGYSLASPYMLILWEAQFGDFVNGAQVIIDQFIVAAQSKWGRSSGLVLLLPHGYEGQGPEHSNAYLERYLTLCAEDNIQVCNLSTPAQYFHALRRQMKRGFRRPLIIMSPKSLLRNKAAQSPLADLSDGRFREVIDDPDPPKNVKRLVLCSGKLFYDLLQRRGAEPDAEVALIRLEQLYPFHHELAQTICEPYQASEIIWAQEEPQNRGAWTYIRPRLTALFPDRAIRYVGRKASASPATGSLRLHRQEQQRIVGEAIVS